MPNLLRDSLLDFENHKSLRRLKLSAKWLPTDPKEAGFLNTLLSLIKSPQLDVVVVYEELGSSPYSAQQWSIHAGGKPNKKSDSRSPICNQHRERFEVLGEAHRARKFRLVLYVDATCEKKVEVVTEALELHVEVHRCGELQSLLSDSLIISAIPCRYPYNITRAD